jgi:exosome complex RNA-binding protein Csl4
MTQIQQHEGAITSALILQGDLAALHPNDKVAYYKGYCERLGLDPYTKPFDILRLNGKEILYLTRSGAQQLNMLHKVSHQITSRRVIDDAGIYEVTCRATLPDGRHTESIGAAHVANLKGEPYCNAMMKAETKAKRRSTLDLIGLGILSEEETSSIPGAQRVEVVLDAETIEESDDEINVADIIKAKVAECDSIAALNDLYRNNQAEVERLGLRQFFSTRKLQINETI